MLILFFVSLHTFIVSPRHIKDVLDVIRSSVKINIRYKERLKIWEFTMSNKGWYY